MGGGVGIGNRSSVAGATRASSFILLAHSVLLAEFNILVDRQSFSCICAANSGSSPVALNRRS